MCGIVGVVRSSHIPIDPRKLQHMTDLLSHRGPDGSGHWMSDDGAVGFGHRRLAILDVSDAGAQPMTSGSSRYVMSYNGEIYNFLDLRKELESRGVTFRSDTDSEVILAGCDVWGVEETLERLNGMFAIALWDKDEVCLTLARDRIGIKPLYYTHTSDGLIFASELRPLVFWNGALPEISQEGLREFLRLGYVPSPLSIFENVKKLSPGHRLTFKQNSIEGPAPYWSLVDAVAAGQSNLIHDHSAAFETLENQLKLSVRRHMISDVSLGAFLSGGIDSSLVVALMQAQSDKPVKTYSVGFDDVAYNEAVHAKKVAKHLRTDHSELVVTEQDALNVVPSLADIYDEPFADISQIPTFLVSRFARQEVSVCLSGDGGDELFAGYNRHVFVAHYWKKLSRLPLAMRKLFASLLSHPSPKSYDALFALMGRLLPEDTLPRTPGQKLHKIASILPSESLLGLHSRVTAQWGAPERVLRNLTDKEPAHFEKMLVENPALDPAIQQSLWDAQTYMVDDVLTKVDRASMHVGLEARVPLLDHDLVELAWRIPSSMKLRDGNGKLILKELLYTYVPRELVDRPKMGFSVPVADWLRGALRDWGETLLNKSRLDQDQIFDSDIVLQTWQKHQSGRYDFSGQLWTVLMFQLWLSEARSWVE